MIRTCSDRCNWSSWRVAARFTKQTGQPYRYSLPRTMGSRRHARERRHLDNPLSRSRVRAGADSSENTFVISNCYSYKGTSSRTTIRGENPQWWEVPASSTVNSYCLEKHLDINIATHYVASMRTTLTLDDDVAEKLREQVRLQDRSFKQVVNDVLRRGLSSDARETPTAVYRIVPNHSALAPGIDPMKLSQISDKLEGESFGGASTAT